MQQPYADLQICTPGKDRVVFVIYIETPSFALVSDYRVKSPLISSCESRKLREAADLSGKKRRDGQALQPILMKGMGVALIERHKFDLRSPGKLAASVRM